MVSGPGEELMVIEISRSGVWVEMLQLQNREQRDVGSLDLLGVNEEREWMGEDVGARMVRVDSFSVDWAMNQACIQMYLNTIH